jgi:tRNA G37 N-methylase TrmD
MFGVAAMTALQRANGRVSAVVWRTLNKHCEQNGSLCDVSLVAGECATGMAVVVASTVIHYARQVMSRDVSLKKRSLSARGPG